MTTADDHLNLAAATLLKEPEGESSGQRTQRQVEALTHMVRGLVEIVRAQQASLDVVEARTVQTGLRAEQGAVVLGRIEDAVAALRGPRRSLQEWLRGTA